MLPLWLKFRFFVPRNSSLIFLSSINPIPFCMQTFLEHGFVSAIDFSIFFCHFFWQSERFGNGVFIETFFKIFFNFLNNFTLFVRLLVPNWLTKLSGLSLMRSSSFCTILWLELPGKLVTFTFWTLIIQEFQLAQNHESL